MKQKFKLLITLLILVGTMLPNTILARSFPDSINNIYELRDTETLNGYTGSKRLMASGVGNLGYYLGTTTQYLPYKVSGIISSGTGRDAIIGDVDYAVYCTHFGVTSPAQNSYVTYCGTDDVITTCTASANSLKDSVPSACTKDDSWDAGTKAAIAYIIKKADGTTFAGDKLKTYYDTESTINYFLYELTDDPTYIQMSNSDITGSSGNKITEYNETDVQNAKAIHDKINNFVSKGNMTINKPTSTELSTDSNGKRWISSVFTINNFIDKYGTDNIQLNATIKDEKGKVYKNYAYITKVGDNNYQVGVCNENTGDYCKDISNFTKLSSGNYTVEIDVSGSYTYDIAQNYSCGTSFQSITPAFTDTVTKTESDTITFTLNIPDELGSIKIVKVDADSGSTITGATITVKSKDGTYNETFTLKNKSTVTINDLKQGTYEITETKAPDGYEKDEKTYEVVLSKTNLLEEVTISNKKIEDKKGSFTLYKIDENQNKIGGSEFKFYYDDNKTEILDVSKRGLKFTDLTLNEEMCLEETKAPTGYKSNTKKFCFKVLESGEIKLNEDYDFVTVSSKNNIYTVNVINYLEDASIVKIKKVDSKDKSKVLEGAKLHVIDENGEEVVEPWITTTEYYVVTGLTKGKYYVEELEAPEGYTLNSTKLDFVIENDTDDIVLEFINEKPVDVPNTLSNISKALVLLAVISILIGSLLIYKNKFSEDGK